MIHRELAAYHNYAPRMVLFPGWLFLILDIGIISGVNVPQKYARLFLLFNVSRCCSDKNIWPFTTLFLNVFRELASLVYQPCTFML